MNILNVLPLHEIGGKEKAFIRNLIQPKTSFNNHALLTGGTLKDFYKQYFTDSQVISTWKYWNGLKIPSVFRKNLLNYRLQTIYPEIDLNLIHDTLNKRRRPLRNHLLKKTFCKNIFYDQGDSLELNKDQEDLLDGYDHYITVSSALKFNLEKRYGIPSRRITTIPNTISRQEFKKFQDSSSSIGDNNKFNILFVGKFSKRKGLNIIIRAASKLEGLDDYIFHVVGGKEPEEMKLLAESYGVLDQFRFHGFVDDPGSYYAGADLKIVPSVSEGLPLVLLEAGAAGLPVVASAVDGIPDVVDDGRTGILLEPSIDCTKYDDFAESEVTRDYVDVRNQTFESPKFIDPEELAQTINWLKNNESEREKMGQNLQERVENKFLADENIDKFEKLFEELVG
jgi:glycosyltransferase involved in cell wall biosynthesis